MGIERALRAYLALFGLLWFAALASVFVQGGLLHKAYPYNTFLFIPEARFTDFTIFYPRFAAWDRTAAFFAHSGFPFFYPPPLLALSLALWKQAPDPLVAYLCVVLGFAVAAGVRFVLGWPKLWLVAGATLAGAYPLWFLLDRANLEGFVWMATVLGVWAFARSRFTWAAAALGLAAAMKIFPGALLLLFLARRKYRHFGMAVGFVVLFTLGSAWFVGPSISGALSGLAAASGYFRETQILAYRAAEIGFEHSLFSCIKQAMHVFVQTPYDMHQLLPEVYLGYTPGAASAFCALYLVMIRKLPVLNQLFALTALSVTLPFISYDYTLVHLYIPFAALLASLTAERPALSFGHAMAFLAPCAVLFAPLSWVLFHTIGCGGQIKTVALVALLGASLKIPLRSSLFEEDREALFIDYRHTVPHGSRLDSRAADSVC